MSVSSNLFEIVPITIGLHPSQVETIMADISIHRFVMPPLSTNDWIQPARAGELDQVKTPDRGLGCNPLLFPAFWFVVRNVWTPSRRNKSVILSVTSDGPNGKSVFLVFGEFFPVIIFW